MILYRVFSLWLQVFEIQLRQKFWPEAYQTFRDYSLIVLALCEYQLVHWFWVFWSGKKRYETYYIFKFGKIRQFLWFSSFLKINLLYIFLHCDWTKQDWNTCEPILERRWTQVSPWIKKSPIRVIATVQKCSDHEAKRNFDEKLVIFVRFISSLFWPKYSKPVNQLIFTQHQHYHWIIPESFVSSVSKLVKQKHFKHLKS